MVVQLPSTPTLTSFIDFVSCDSYLHVSYLCLWQLVGPAVICHCSRQIFISSNVLSGHNFLLLSDLGSPTTKHVLPSSFSSLTQIRKPYLGKHLLGPCLTTPACNDESATSTQPLLLSSNCVPSSLV